MKPINPATDVVPLSEFRANLAELLKQTQQTGRPIVITQHGRGSAVLISADAYAQLLDELELSQAVIRGQSDIIAGRTVSHEEAMKEFKQIIADAQKKQKKAPKSKRGGKDAA